MERKQRSAFITTRKGFCYLTIKHGKYNSHLMRIRNYTIDAEEKRHLRRLYPDVVFDWNKIAKQLAEKREVCREYRSRRIAAATERRKGRSREPFCGVFDPGTRTIYANDPSNIAGVGALLDAIVQADRTMKDTPAPLAPGSDPKP